MFWHALHKRYGHQREDASCGVRYELHLGELGYNRLPTIQCGNNYVGQSRDFEKQ
jgi:hypothetical protein